MARQCSADGWPLPASDHCLLKLTSLKGRHRVAMSALRQAETKEQAELIRLRLVRLATEIREVSKRP